MRTGCTHTELSSTSQQPLPQQQDHPAARRGLSALHTHFPEIKTLGDVLEHQLKCAIYSPSFWSSNVLGQEQPHVGLKTGLCCHSLESRFVLQTLQMLYRVQLGSFVWVCLNPVIKIDGSRLLD